MKLSTILSTILLTVSSVAAHKTLEVPASRDLKANNNDPAKTPCGKYAKGPVVATYNAGENVPVKLKGSANHNGGGCVFSLSYDDGKSFKVIHVTDESCPIKSEFSVPIPKDAPSCESCIFAWSWIPVSSGQPEHYFQCADISIKGSASGTLQGMEVPRYNLEGGQKHYNPQSTLPWVKLPEFANYKSGTSSGKPESKEYVSNQSSSASNGTVSSGTTLTASNGSSPTPINSKSSDSASISTPAPSATPKKCRKKKSHY